MNYTKRIYFQTAATWAFGPCQSWQTGVSACDLVIQHACPCLPPIWAYYGGSLALFRKPSVLGSESQDAPGVEAEDDLIFLYRLAKGRASASYGFQCALKAGLPHEVSILS